MTAFHLKIVTPDGLFFDGDAFSLTVRTVAGDVGILAGHLDLVTALGMGRATVVTDQGTRYAACIGGMLSVEKELVTLVATTFEWAEDIDTARAQASYERAQGFAQQKRQPGRAEAGRSPAKAGPGPPGCGSWSINKSSAEQ